MSSKAKKKAALNAIRARKRGAVFSSRTDEYEVTDPGDVYDVVEEEDYRTLVDKRRDREDFVVDDGKLSTLESPLTHLCNKNHSRPTFSKSTHIKLLLIHFLFST